MTSFLCPPTSPIPGRGGGHTQLFLYENLKNKINLYSHELQTVGCMPHATHRSGLQCTRVCHGPVVALWLRNPNAADIIAAFKTSLLDNVFPGWGLSSPSSCPAQPLPLHVPNYLSSTGSFDSGKSAFLEQTGSKKTGLL